jgi:periplasmic protein TonB
MVVPAAFSVGRLPAPSARPPRVSIALSLGLHGLAVVLLVAAGAAGSASTSEHALLVELALAAPATAEADEPAEVTPEREVTIELAPPEEPPPLDVSDLKPIEPPKPKPPPQAEQKRPAAKPAAPPRAVSRDFGTASEAQQAAAGFLAAPNIVWEGKPRYRHPPTPAVYPPRAIELNQQGEAVVRVRLDADGAAVEIVLFRGSGFELLDRAALAAVRGWHFLPAVRDGRPVAAWVEIPVRFHLR